MEQKRCLAQPLGCPMRSAASIDINRAARHGVFSYLRSLRVEQKRCPGKHLRCPSSTQRAIKRAPKHSNVTRSGSGSQGQKSLNACTIKATFYARAMCPFSSDLWNLGATCIKNHVHGDKYPQCDDGANVKLISSIRTVCRNATDADNQFCGTTAMVY